MRGESVGAPVQGWLLLRQDSEPEKQKTDDSMGVCVCAGAKGSCVPSVRCLCLPLRGVKRIWLPYCA